MTLKEWGDREVGEDDDLKEFVQDCASEIGLGFHPDTRFEDYTFPDGSRCFDDQLAVKLNAIIDQAFEQMDDEIYDVAAHVCDDDCRSNGCPLGR